MRKVKVEQAVGLTLGYDITKIVPGKEKKRAFRRGQVIGPDDVAELKDIGKEHIYVWEQDGHMVHEDEAALRLAQLAAGPGLYWGEPSEGRVNLKASYDGLLKVNVQGLTKLNDLENVVFATLHNNRVVNAEQILAGTRVVPIAVEESMLAEAEELGRTEAPILSIKPFKPLRAAVVVTGTEVSSGRIKDGFADAIKDKIAPFVGEWAGHVIVPDDAELITRGILKFVQEGAQLVVVTGGMSVDADDVTPQAIRDTRAEVIFHGVPILPGCQFMLAYLENVTICGVPGGALLSRKTTFDLLLPRIFAEDRIKRSEVVAMGHGGLCENCTICDFPQCAFGKS